MPAGGSRRGRRDNGLSAAEYAAVGDVDPRVGEHLLDVLAGDGIAAYLLPATDLHPVTRTTTLPAVPTDRLYADRDHLGTAKDYLTRLRDEEAAASSAGVGPMPAGVGKPGAGASGAGARDVDMDAAWASIVAGYEAEVDDTTAPWPSAENLPDRGPDDTDPDLGRNLGFDVREVDEKARPAPDRPTLPTPHPDEPTLLDALDTFAMGLPATDDEGYTPPPPPPVPRPSAPVVLALIGIVAGVVLFFAPELLPIDSDVTMVFGFLLLLAGVVGLIWRLRPGDDEESDGDDGAIV